MKCVPGQKNKQTNTQNSAISFPSAGQSLQVKWKEKHVRGKNPLTGRSHFLVFLFYISFWSQGSSSLTDGRQDFYCCWTQTTYRVARTCTQTLFLGDVTLFLVLHHLWGTSTLMWPPHHFLSHHFLFILWPHDALTEAGKWPGCWTKLFQ